MSEFMQLIVNGLLLGGIYAVIAAGLTIIFGVMNVVNFAQGDFLMMAMYFTFFLNKFSGLDPYLSIIIVAIAFLFLGVLVEKTLITKVINEEHEKHILLTLGIALLLRSGAAVFFGPDYRGITVPYRFKSYEIANVFISYPRLLSFLVAVFLMIVLWLFLTKTEFGRAMRASAENRDSAELMGINSERMFVAAFAIGTMFAAIGGVALMPFYYVFPEVGVYPGTLAFIVVVLGGLESVPGAVVGALFVGIIESLSGEYLDLALSQFGVFIIFILVLLFKPQGLLGGEKIS